MNDENGDFQKQINYYLQHIPLKVFKANLLEITQCAFRFQNEKEQEKNIFHKIFLRLWNNNPFDIYYSIENLKMNLDAPVFVELHKKLEIDYKLMEKALSFRDLSILVDKYTKDSKLIVFVLIK